MVEQVPLFISFLAGVLSFLSPCVLPLIPAYISFITGLSVAEMTSPEVVQRDIGRLRGILAQSLLFVSGFSLIFVLMGASATYLGGLIATYHHILRIGGGIVVVAFGLHMMGVFNLKFLQYERRTHLERKPAHFFGAAVVGAAFALGWTPCIGPILGSILTYASTQKTVTKGILLLSLYSLGMAIPFLASSLAIGGFLRIFSRIKNYFRVISFVSGGILIVVGILILTGNLQRWI
ncbi:MAG: cytochrome c biogenesis protein CcdA [Deltaproteobacteria bacterium]|nr:MAG: cytochrome c biogenesis protein CcdA [Deltaproteobacteria bacterium]